MFVIDWSNNLLFLPCSISETEGLARPLPLQSPGDDLLAARRYLIEHVSLGANAEHFHSFHTYFNRLTVHLALDGFLQR